LKRFHHPEVAARHVISMTRDYTGDVAHSVAKCQCGWLNRVKLPMYRDQDTAIEQHWQHVIDAFEGMPS
jgi:hypothetical protein